MIEIIDKSKCTGCGACIAKCVKNAISFQEDDEGVRYPIVNDELCVDCGQCDTVCPMLIENHGLIRKNSIEFYYAAQLKEIDELNNVSSGGAFLAFVKLVINKGGVIYGAKQESVDYIKHCRATDIAKAKEFCRSKYLQSDCSDIYTDVKNDLTEGYLVLFSGTGCQIAGLNLFLGKDYENLITCEVVCHGVPCGGVWKSYRSELERKKGKQIKNLVFRDKSLGWSQNQYKIEYSDGTVEYEHSVKQIFHRGYLMGLFYRPSCGKCLFAKTPRVADITLADYWKYNGELLKNGDKGISLILASSEKGLRLVDESQKYINIEGTSKKDAKISCRHLDNSPEANPNRDAFVRDVMKRGYHNSYRKYTKKNSVFERAINIIKRMFG